LPHENQTDKEILKCSFPTTLRKKKKVTQRPGCMWTTEEIENKGEKKGRRKSGTGRESRRTNRAKGRGKKKVDTRKKSAVKNCSLSIAGGNGIVVVTGKIPQNEGGVPSYCSRGVRGSRGRAQNY